FLQHLRMNHYRPDRIYCSFHERTTDIEDNRIVKAALSRLASYRSWTTDTTHDLRRNLGVFCDVGQSEDLKVALASRTYSRMTEDYRVLHALSWMFLENLAISERIGDVRFKGFLLDMNKLFERFVSTAFINAAVATSF